MNQALRPSGPSENRLVIAHRVCPALSRGACGFASKLDMVTATTRSLHDALAGLPCTLLVILDGCPASYRQLFEDVFSDWADGTGPNLTLIETPGIGNNATFGMQLDLLLKHAGSDDLVYFSEDDYLYTPDAFPAMISALSMPQVDFVTPLDHPDRYLSVMPERRMTPILVNAYCHWRRVSNTCCTFMTTRSMLSRHEKSLRSYARGATDGTLWHSITKDRMFHPKDTVIAALRYLSGQRGTAFIPLVTWRRNFAIILSTPRAKLWSPLPSLAVHICDKSLPLGAHRLFSPALRASIRQAELAYLGIDEPIRVSGISANAS